MEDLASGTATSGSPHPGKPDSGKPDSGKPDSGNAGSGNADSGNAGSGKTVYYTATSADGFIADADNSLDWLFSVEHTDPDEFSGFFAGVGAMCMGATTYEWVLNHENLLAEPEKWRGYYGETPAWVFTHRDLPAIPGVDIRFVSGDVVPVHAAMTEAAAGKNLWIVGGGELVGRFADAHLLDEIILGVTPVFLGAGAPLLPRRLLSDRVRLTGVKQDGQMVVLTYSVARVP